MYPSLTPIPGPASKTLSNYPSLTPIPGPFSKTLNKYPSLTPIPGRVSKTPHQNALLQSRIALFQHQQALYKAQMVANFLAIENNIDRVCSQPSTYTPPGYPHWYKETIPLDLSFIYVDPAREAMINELLGFRTEDDDVNGSHDTESQSDAASRPIPSIEVENVSADANSIPGDDYKHKDDVAGDYDDIHAQPSSIQNVSSETRHPREDASSEAASSRNASPEYASPGYASSEDASSDYTTSEDGDHTDDEDIDDASDFELTTPNHSQIIRSAKRRLDTIDSEQRVAKRVCRSSTPSYFSNNRPNARPTKNVHVNNGSGERGAKRVRISPSPSYPSNNSQNIQSAERRQVNTDLGERAAKRIRSSQSLPNPADTPPEKGSKKGGTWTDIEHAKIERELRSLRAEEARRGIDRMKGLRDVALWSHISSVLETLGVYRSPSACKNYWSRYGRVRSGYDERAIPTDQLATSLQ